MIHLEILPINNFFAEFSYSFKSTVLKFHNVYKNRIKNMKSGFNLSSHFNIKCHVKFFKR